MKKMSLLTALIAAVAVTAYSVSGTYAKYTSTFTGESSARVAAWAFQINDKAPTAENKFEFNLFESVNDANVTKGIGENIIAPGTTGSFDIKLANLSEVAATATITFAADLAGVPIEFSTGNGVWGDISTVTQSIEKLSQGTRTSVTAEDSTTSIQFNAGSDTTFKIYWRWAFTGDQSTTFTTSQTDTTDTALGTAEVKATPKVTATIVATQVD